MSELIRWAEYQPCVAEGVCPAPPSRAACTQVATRAVRCVHFSQALTYVAWLQKKGALSSSAELRALPTQLELKRLYEAHPESIKLSGEVTGKVTMEWLTSAKSPSAPLPLRALKVAPKELTARVSGGRLVTQPIPPAFQLPQLSFRLSAPSERGACPQLP